MLVFCCSNTLTSTQKILVNLISLIKCVFRAVKTQKCAEEGDLRDWAENTTLRDQCSNL